MAHSKGGVRHIDCDLYNLHVIVAQVPMAVLPKALTVAGLAKLVPHLNSFMAENEGIDGRFSDFGSYGLIWVDPSATASVRARTLAHEVFHATVWALRRAGAALTPESEEAYAYFNSWLMAQVQAPKGRRR